MTDNVADVARRLGLKGHEGMKQVRRLISRLVDRHKAAARLFIGADGAVTPDAARWFAQLAADNFVNSGSWHDDPRVHAMREGRRALALDIIRSARLDVDRLNSLIELEREIQK